MAAASDRRVAQRLRRPRAQRHGDRKEPVLSGPCDHIAQTGHCHIPSRRPDARPVSIPNPTPYTLHPTPYTLHPTPYTLHPTPYTLHPTPYTLHPTPCTLHPEKLHIHSQARSVSFQTPLVMSRPTTQHSILNSRHQTPDTGHQPPGVKHNLHSKLERVFCVLNPQSSFPGVPA